MAAEGDGAPSWLFSFVDLAFLSMIAMTQLTSAISEPTPDLGEMVVPEIGREVTTQLATGSSDLWQLRVHPADEEKSSPFELVHALGDVVEGEGMRLEVDELYARLLHLRDDLGRKPLLAPHEDSRSQDMLDAAALIEELWPSRRRAVVAKGFETT